MPAGSSMKRWTSSTSGRCLSNWFGDVLCSEPVTAQWDSSCSRHSQLQHS
jgi:hypothetical protein